MKKLQIPWQSWYGDVGHEIWFPNDWPVHLAEMAGGQELNDEQIAAGLDHPVGTPTIADLARGKRSCVIVTDDISRPTMVGRILEQLLPRLHGAGIGEEDVKILVATGAHRPMSREDFVKKFGLEVVRKYHIVNHHPYENLTDVPFDGGIFRINATFMAAELKISIGAVMPHSIAGYGGGAKVIIPGIAGIETLESNHRLGGVVKGNTIQFTPQIGRADNNPVRAEMEKAARAVGLSFSVNCVVDSRRRIVGITAGDPVEAHRSCIPAARRVLCTPVPAEPLELIIANSYPKDTEFHQAGNCSNLLVQIPEERKGEVQCIVIATASSEGVGFHSLNAPGTRQFAPNTFHRHASGPLPLIIYSPNLNKAGVQGYYPDISPPVCNTWDQVIETLQRVYHRPLQTVVFPAASMQLLS